MKYIGRYLCRLDIVQTASRMLLAILVLLFVFTLRSSITFFGRAVLMGGILLCAIFAALKIPKVNEIMEYLTGLPGALMSEAKRDYRGFAGEDPYVLSVYTPEKAFLARTVSNRLIFPVSLTVLLRRTATGYVLLAREICLLRKRPDKTVYRMFDAEHPLRVEAIRLDGDAEIVHCTVYAGEEEVITFYSRDDHGWKHFVEYIRADVALTWKE